MRRALFPSGRGGEGVGLERAPFYALYKKRLGRSVRLTHRAGEKVFLDDSGKKARVFGKHARDWTRDDLRRLSTALDEKVREGRASWKTAQNAWGTATRMCDDAVRHKSAAIRCREDNPARDVRGPDRGATKAREFLYPAEFVRFATSEDVPLEWTRLVAVAIYMFLRAGELQALRWQDVNLDNRTTHVHRARNRRTGTIKHTKGRAARRIPIHAFP